MNYRHNLNYNYPERSDEHMIDVPHLRDANVDENYPFRKKGFWHKFKRGVLWVLLNAVVFLVVTVPTNLLLVVFLLLVDVLSLFTLVLLVVVTVVVVSLSPLT